MVGWVSSFWTLQLTSESLVHNDQPLLDKIPIRTHTVSEVSATIDIFDILPDFSQQFLLSLLRCSQASQHQLPYPPDSSLRVALVFIFMLVKLVKQHLVGLMS